MTWDLDGHEVLTYLVALVAAALAVLLVRAHRIRAQNRWFLALLAVESVEAIGGATTTVTTDVDVAYAAAVTLVVGISFAFPVYIGFLSTLGGPVGRSLRKPVMRFLPWIFPVVGLGALLFRRSLIIANPDPTAPDVWATVGGPMFRLFQICALAMWILGLVAAIAYWRSTPAGTSLRRQSRIFAIAFGIHDGGMILAIGVSVAGAASTGVGWAIAYYGLPLVKLALLTLLTYGIVRVQLFDIDLHIKIGISRSTVAALGIIAVLGAAKAVEFYLSRELGIVAGGLAAGIVLFLAPRLNRLGDKVANAALPNVQPTPVYLAFKKLEVYRAAVESAWETGGVADRERASLARLREKLGLAVQDAEAVEAEVQATPALAAPARQTTGSAGP